MTEHSDEAWLIALANDVCDGRRIDWDAVVPANATTENKNVVEGLRRLTTVVEAHRTLGGSPAPEPPSVDQAAPAAWGHLVLLETVGQGAFGTVYRAWDAQLDREVALKVLLRVPIESPLDEARHLARVRHPNVVAIYGAELVEEQVGIWMEFIEGETLATIVRERGTMSAREVAGIGIDLCRALSALHRSGLLHGDIKAHNVMREVGGRIVLMDFSGVRVADADGLPELSGTPLYMAPELFDGRPASFTADIYSLGILLFYLLSGHFPVEGADVAEIRRLHASGERIRLRDMRPELTDPVVQLVERATAVAPAARFHTAGDLEHALAGIFAHGVAVTQSDLDRLERSRLALRWWMLAAAILALVGGVAVWKLLSLDTRSATPLVHLGIGHPMNTGPWPRISPDGRLLVFGTTVNGRKLLWIRSVDSMKGHAIQTAETTETPFWSADSRRVAFFADGKLKSVDLDNEHVETLADAPAPHGGDWNAEGVLLYGSAGGISRVSADGSNRASVTVLDEAAGDYQHGWPEFLPDGRRFLYIIRSRIEARTGLYLGSIDSSLSKRIMPAYSRVAYSFTHHLLFVRNGTLTAQPFDPDLAELSGAQIALAAPVKAHVASDGAFDVSANGILTYRLNEALPSTRLLLFDRRGREMRAVTTAGFYRHPRFSPDGNRIAAEQSDMDTPNPDIWLFGPAADRASRFTTLPSPDIRPAWSPDGRRLAFSSKRGTTYDIYVKTLDALEEEQVLWRTESDKLVEDWSPDGRALSVTVLRSGLWSYPTDPAQKPTLIRPSLTAETWQSEFSPDGRWLAYVSGEFGRSEVYVEPVPATGQRWQVSANGGAEPHWSRDTHELFYLTIDQWIAAITVPSTDTWSLTAPSRLFKVTIPETVGGSDFAVGPSGDFVVNTLQADQAIPPIEVLVNWTGLLTH
jgi:serine/threonine protein kinase/Tol biopolymer transport system component